MADPVLGAIADVDVGATFPDRAALAQAGVHRQVQAGINRAGSASGVDVSARTPTQLLETSDALLTRSHLRELGLERRAVDAVFRACPNILLPGYSRPMIYAADYRALLDASTYRDDRVYPGRT